MTKCLPSQCRSKTSFFYKVLVAIKQLLSTRKFCNGVSQADIAKFMEKNNCLTGDINSQLENALCVAEASRFITKQNKLYSLVSPAANIHLIPEECVKNKLKEIQHSFDSAQCPSVIGARSTRQSNRINFQNSSKNDNKNSTKKLSPRNRKRLSTSNSRSRSKSSSRSKSRSVSPPGRKGRQKKRKKQANGPCLACPPQQESSMPGFEPLTKKPSKSCIKKDSCNEIITSSSNDVNVIDDNDGKCGSDTDSSEN